MKNFEIYVNTLKRKTLFIDNKKIIFICIGKSSILWDSLGPLVGSNLRKYFDSKKVIGDMNNNICNKLDLLRNYNKIKNKFVIAIDTAISTKALNGEIFINNSPIALGTAVKKHGTSIGDLSIKAIISNPNEIKKDYIINFAEFISLGICKFMYSQSNF